MVFNMLSPEGLPRPTLRNKARLGVAMVFRHHWSSGGGELTRPGVPNGKLLLRAVLIDVAIAPLVGFFIGTVGTVAGSPGRGVLGAGIWVVAAFVPTFLALRHHAEEVSAGRPDRFKPPRWLQQQGVGWSMEMAHLQRRRGGQSSSLQSFWYAEGHLYPTSDSFEFVPNRLEQNALTREFATAPYPSTLSFSNIERIDVAVPTGIPFVNKKFPRVQVVLVDGGVEWFSPKRCLASEASALLNGFLPPVPDQRSDQP